MSTLEDNVRSWLSRHGYPLELRVAGLLRQAGLSADHHRVYADPVTAKSRESDEWGTWTIQNYRYIW